MVRSKVHTWFRSRFLLLFRLLLFLLFHSTGVLYLGSVNGGQGTEVIHRVTRKGVAQTRTIQGADVNSAAVL